MDSWDEIEFRRLRNKIFKGTNSDSELIRYKELHSQIKSKTSKE